MSHGQKAGAMMGTAKVLIEATDVAVAFSGHTVLSGVDVRVRAGEIVTLIGPNGAGKTTLVRVILGLIKPTRGTVQRQKGLTVGYMPQRLTIDPAMPITVKRFLQLGVARGLTVAACERVLADVGAKHVLRQSMQGLSGGEMQRVLLARALVRQPDLLVLDEPVQGVDLTGQAELYRLVQTIREQRGVGVLMVSHDLHVVMAQTDHVICLNRHVCCAGHPEVVSRDPQFSALFGLDVAAALAVYTHRHDHTHDLDGHVLGEPGVLGEPCDHG